MVEDIQLAPVRPPIQEENPNVPQATHKYYSWRQHKTLLEVPIARTKPPEQAKARHDVHKPLQDDRVDRRPVYRVYFVQLLWQRTRPRHGVPHARLNITVV